MFGIPKWVLVGLGIIALLVAPLLVITKFPAESAGNVLKAAEFQRASKLIAIIESGDMAEARRLFALNQQEPFPAEAYRRILKAIQNQHDSALTTQGLFLYGDILGFMVRRGIPCPRFEEHLRRLRHGALTFEEREFYYDDNDSLFAFILAYMVGSIGN